MGWSSATTSSIESFDPAKNPTLARVARDTRLQNFQEGKDFWVVGHDVGAELNDLPIFTTAPGTIRLQKDGRPVSRQGAEGVPGGFLIQNVLSEHECDQIIKLTETLGFTEDGLNARAHGRRNENCLWLADDGLCEAIFERCTDFFPSEVAGGAVCGLNARWRVYKYNPGDTYVAHVDSSFPGSGLDRNGRLVRDRYGDRWSRLTFVVYLNDDFKGGCTRFYISEDGRSEPRIAEVQAVRGAATCFFHGDHSQSLNLPHEGALLEEGTKYVFRTDVLYKLQKQDLHAPLIGPVLPPEGRAASRRSRSRSRSRQTPENNRGRWWSETEQLQNLSLKAILKLCSLTQLQQRRGAIVCDHLGAAGDGACNPWLGWSGLAAELSTCSAHPFLLFPGDGEQNTFSLERHRSQAAKVVPTLAFWQWLSSSEKAWQFRGELEPSKVQLRALLGPELEAVVEKGIFRVTQVSVWSGRGGTRTPLHSDSVHALIFQLAGAKRFFLSSRAQVEDAVARRSLPEALMCEHAAASRTDAFCVDGSLNEVHGLCEAEPRRAKGQVAVLRAGDCLVLPAGVYHDVECAVTESASMSVTVRFALDEWNCETSSDDSESE